MQPVITFNKRKWIPKILIGISIILIFLYGVLTPMPEGTSYKGTPQGVSDVRFLYDVSYENAGEIIHQQKIFDEELKLIGEADRFIIADLFLFNDDYNRKNSFPDLASQLTQALINQKKSHPDMEAIFITDEINNFYGAYESKFIKELKDQGIQVIITDTNQMRNSNPAYSGFYKTFLQWWGTGGKGWLPNPFGPYSPKVTLRAYLKLLNFKANHRKVLITDKAAIVASANPHDASAYHSNMAFRVEGEVINDLIQSEKAVARFSGYDLGDIKYIAGGSSLENISAELVTEGKIRESILETVKNTQANEKITMGMFYISERSMVDELVKAAQRGVLVRLVLDPNKDAFGIEKNGLPNRQVAMELFKRSGGSIQIRWYDTHGEQYHTKMLFVEKADKAIIIGGSANLTRRNICDYNMETDLRITAGKDSNIAREVESYFTKIWDNAGGNYTADFSKYREDKFFKHLLYRLQEWSGLSTF